VIKILKLLLKMDVDGEEHGVKEMGFEKIIEQQKGLGFRVERRLLLQKLNALMQNDKGVQ
jgi:hypothetical protein